MKRSPSAVSLVYLPVWPRLTSSQEIQTLYDLLRSYSDLRRFLKGGGPSAEEFRQAVVEWSGQPYRMAAGRMYLRIRILGFADQVGKSKRPNELQTVLKNIVKDKNWMRLCDKQPLTNEVIDRILGLDERHIQKKMRLLKVPVYQVETTYPELDPKDLFTPYPVIIKFLKKLEPRESWVDLGSGLGRMVLVAGVLYPKVKFVGVELVEDRVRSSQRAAKRLGLKKVNFLQRNLAHDPVPFADGYYLFNPFSPRTLARVTRVLKAESLCRPLRLAVVHTGIARLHIEKRSWLKETSFVDCSKYWSGTGVTLYESIIPSRRPT